MGLPRIDCPFRSGNNRSAILFVTDTKSLRLLCWCSCIFLWARQGEIEFQMCVKSNE